MPKVKIQKTRKVVKSRIKPSPVTLSLPWFRMILASKLGLAIILMAFVIPLSAFEAHVVNVTATIERPPCQEYQTGSMGFWKEHDDLWIFPQTLGANEILNAGDANYIFDLPNNEAINKLKKQLLALKFNLSYYGAGPGLVPGETTTLEELAAEADALLIGGGTDAEYNAMKNRLESANTAHTVNSCPVIIETGSFSIESSLPESPTDESSTEEVPSEETGEEPTDEPEETTTEEETPPAEETPPTGETPTEESTPETPSEETPPTEEIPPTETHDDGGE